MMGNCACVPKCVSLQEHLSMASSFASFSEVDRNNILRGRLLCLTAPRGNVNGVMVTDPVISLSKRYKRRRPSTREYSFTRYALLSTGVCRYGFAAVVQLHRRTLRSFPAALSHDYGFLLQRNAHSSCRRGKHSLQAATALSFLHRYADANAFSCATRRGSGVESPIQWLSSDVGKDAIYEMYKERWEDIMECATVSSSACKPDSALSKSGFLKVWGTHFLTLLILKAGKDFCDQCTTLHNSAKSTINLDLRETLLLARKRHRAEVLQEFTLYRPIRGTCTKVPATKPIHLVLDFAKKVLLPHLLRQPGQHHFQTGLKFDIFGIYSSSLNLCYIYGHPEGHWPHNKTCNEVVFMLNHTIAEHNHSGSVTEGNKRIDLHGDNCSGQSKNQFMMSYLLWRVWMGYKEEITLRVLIAGHTKNRCDAAFGLVKRTLKQFDVFGPRDMMKVLDESSHSNKAVSAANSILVCLENNV